MKNVTFSFAAFLLSAACMQAQTITSAWAPAPWAALQTFVVEETQGIQPGSSGQGQTWDFSSISSDTSYIETILPPQGQQGAAGFPDATVARVISNAQFTAASFFNTSASAYTFLGSESEASGFTASNVYSDPVDYIRFPVGFGQAYTDDFAAEISSFGISYNREGSLEVEVDGEGTLTTPYGTYSNVLRVKTTENYQLLGLPPIPGASTSGVLTTWAYISAQFPGIYLLTYNTSDDNIGNRDTTISYANPGFQILPTADQPALAVFPQPASHSMFIQSSTPIIEVSLIDMQGRFVRRETSTGQNFIEINTSAMDSGVYLGRILFSDGTQQVKRIVVSH